MAGPLRVLVAEPLSERGLELLRQDFDVDVRHELAGDPEALIKEIGQYDALIVRSQTKVTDAVIAAAENLKVVARAGIGLDNVDVEAATRRGIMVVNAPQSNIVSAAEHTIALMLAQARNIPQANQALKGGEWARDRFTGMELAGKTLGIVGLGRVGAMVAQRALAFGMRLIAFDPFIPKDRARQMGVELVANLEAMLAQADIVTIHLPKNPETNALIGEAQLALMKQGARIVNTARGGIVDEDALAKSIKDGHIGGAAIDVFVTEPTTEHALFEFDNVVVTPHLGASTAEAQDKAGTAIAEMVSLALKGEFVPYAVNVSAAAEVPEQVRPFMGLAERLGAIITGLADGPMRSFEAEYLGKIAEHDTRVLTLAALKGSLAGVVHEPVSFVNAPVIAKERGLNVSEKKSSVSRDYVNLVTLRADTEAGEVTVSGSLVGKKDAERLTMVNGFDVDMAPAKYMAFFLYEDRPGVIGTVGSLLGEAQVNIASMEVSRKEQGGRALMGLTVDSPIPEDVLAQIVERVGVDRARPIVLPG
jgi:D-3-phosphoglycerate dehydrogenase